MSDSSPGFPQVAIKQTDLLRRTTFTVNSGNAHNGYGAATMQTFGNDEISAFTPDYE